MHKPLVCFGELLENWVLENRDPVEVKEAKTRRYVLANSTLASLFGSTANQLIGLDANALAEINNLKPSLVEMINTVDHQIVHKKESIRFQHVFFTAKKTILVEEITKQPVFGHQKEVVAILNHARDLTPYIDLWTLFGYYQDLYCGTLKQSQSEAIKAFLHYLKLDYLFYKMPTLRELHILLVMRNVCHTKYVAKTLGIRPKTVDMYKVNLRQKLKIPDYELLLKLRTHHEFK